MANPRRPGPSAGETLTSALVDAEEARVRRSGFVPLARLGGRGLPLAAREALVDALGARGLDRLPAGMRVPALEQLQGLVARGEPVPVSELKARLAKVSKGEVESALADLLVRGGVEIGIWKKQEVLVGARAARAEEGGESLIDEAEASVRASGALSWAELKRLSRPALSERGASYLSGQLARRGLEVLPGSRGVRLPLEQQILGALAGGARVPLASLGGRLKGLARGSKKAAGAAAASALRALVERGEARVVVRGSIEVVVGRSEHALSNEEMVTVERAAERLGQAIALRRKSAIAGTSVLREDLAALLEPLRPWVGAEPAPDGLAAATPAREPSRGELLAAMKRLADPGFGLISIPALVGSLGGARSAEAVHRALRRGQGAGAIELRPETSPDRLSAEERCLCLPGPQRSLLSYAVLADEGLLP